MLLKVSLVDLNKFFSKKGSVSAIHMVRYKNVSSQKNKCEK